MMLTKTFFLAVLACLLLINYSIVGQKLYGTTIYGGVNDLGVLFEYDAGTDNYSKKFDFGGLNGVSPEGSLALAANGKIYGLTSTGGANARGVLFEFDNTINSLSKKIDLIDSTGMNPYGALCFASNGNFYGITYAGGATIDNAGVIFEYNPTTNIYIRKRNLTASTGVNPYGALIQAGNGKLYGLTKQGGTTGNGTLIEYDINTNSCITRFNFDAINGAGPEGSLFQASDGKLYGLTAAGGANNAGVLFAYDVVSNSYTKKIDLAHITGYLPRGSLMQASNGKLYGLTFSGGINSVGTLFEYDILLNIYTKKIDFIPSKGKLPIGSLIQASNGKLYGTTQYGGSSDLGVIFEYDITTNSYTKKVDFTGLNGSTCAYVQLIEAFPNVSVKTFYNTYYPISLYPNPTSGIFTIDLKTPSEVIIINILGEVISDEKLISGKHSLNIQLQSNGVYFVKIGSANGQQTVKLIKH